jgi:hypothetical protein
MGAYPMATPTSHLSLEQILRLREGMCIQFQHHDWEIVRIVRPDPLWQETDHTVFLLFRTEAVELAKEHMAKKVYTLLVTEDELKANALQA